MFAQMSSSPSPGTKAMATHLQGIETEEDPFNSYAMNMQVFNN
jgi:hypothetical protein